MNRAGALSSELASSPESRSPQSSGRRWLFALKLASWPKLLVPAGLGVALGARAAGALELWGALLALGFSGALLGMIVLLNDFADREVDALKRRRFPEAGSAKTLFDGVLSTKQVLLGGLSCALLALSLSALAAVLLGRVSLLWGGALCLSIFCAYSLPPLRINYRGGGELLEMLGVGAVLPWWTAQTQGATPWTALWLPLSGYLLLSLSSALASGLSDELSDRAGGKRTVASLFGNAPARRACELSALLGVGAWAALGLSVAGAPRFQLLSAALIAGVFLVQVLRLSAATTSRAYRFQKTYKLALHRAIWWSGAWLSLTL